MKSPPGNEEEPSREAHTDPLDENVGHRISRQPHVSPTDEPEDRLLNLGEEPSNELDYEEEPNTGEPDLHGLFDCVRVSPRFEKGSQGCPEDYELDDEEETHAVKEPSTRSIRTQAGLGSQEGNLEQPYHRRWATERRHLPDVVVARAGGWTNTVSLKAAYQQADPETILKVILEPGQVRKAQGRRAQRTHSRTNPARCMRWAEAECGFTAGRKTNTGRGAVR